jgi:hypothetical protein
MVVEVVEVEICIALPANLRLVDLEALVGVV